MWRTIKMKWCLSLLFASMEKVYGLSEITRHNMYTASEISGGAAMVTVAGRHWLLSVKWRKKHCGFCHRPTGVSKRWSSRGNESGLYIPYLFGICFVLSLPNMKVLFAMAVVLSLPAGIFRSLLRSSNYSDLKTISTHRWPWVMRWLVCWEKMPLLIVEFAVQKHRSGASVFKAAVEGAAVRFRPILMTSFCLCGWFDTAGICHRAGQDRANRTIGSAISRWYVVWKPCSGCWSSWICLSVCKDLRKIS